LWYKGRFAHACVKVTAVIAWSLMGNVTFFFLYTRRGKGLPLEKAAQNRDQLSVPLLMIKA